MAALKYDHPDLTDKHLLFVSEYLKDYIATSALKRCGWYRGKEYQQYAHQLMQLPKIKNAIAKETRARLVANTLDADKILKEYMILAFYDVKDIYTHRYRLYTKKQSIIEALMGLYGDDLSADYFDRWVMEDHKKHYIMYKRAKTFDEMGDFSKAIVGVSYDKDGHMVLKLADKQKALENLAKYCGIFEPKQDNKKQIVNLELSNDDVEI